MIIFSKLVDFHPRKRRRNKRMLHSSGNLDSSYFDQCLQPLLNGLKRTRLTARPGP
ncbi:hypothetical protein M3484_21705 [Pseudomonas sp. GX19020]|uniref:hypothetical protein n=1 Tax=Pseudomonas sp. GX19020 TaxID=2942277 RepID=UPI002019E5FF|nr:hypothetical protein [Pseudomonas sp. GX19020]MCL4069178.1 hypothetical protein [Pseudomonas sp. GX19020]